MTAPVVGDIVFYRSSDAPDRGDPAIVTAILDDSAAPCVNLTVFRDAQAIIQAEHVEPWAEVEPPGHGYISRDELPKPAKSAPPAAPAKAAAPAQGH
jgi:hypothetical protein